MDKTEAIPSFYRLPYHTHIANFLAASFISIPFI